MEGARPPARLLREPGQCEPADEAGYRTTSDPVIAFDDEGNAYANVLDAPGGTFAFRGFNMTFHIKKPGQPWSDKITAHDNRATRCRPSSSSTTRTGSR